MKRHLVLFAAAATLLAAASASAGSKRIDYAAYAGEPVKEIRYFQLYNWQRTGNKSMVLWTKPSSAYLLTFQNNCVAVAGPMVSIQVGGVASIKGRIQANADDVIIGDLRCRIVGIQPLDMARLKADRKS